MYRLNIFSKNPTYNTGILPKLKQVPCLIPWEFWERFEPELQDLPNLNTQWLETINLLLGSHRGLSTEISREPFVLGGGKVFRVARLRTETRYCVLFPIDLWVSRLGIEVVLLVATVFFC